MEKAKQEPSIGGDFAWIFTAWNHNENGVEPDGATSPRKVGIAVNAPTLQENQHFHRRNSCTSGELDFTGNSIIHPYIFLPVHSPDIVLQTSMREMSRQVRDVRSQLEEDENLKVLMASLRGANLSDADFADSSVQMRLVNVVDAGDGEALPLEYDPELIEEYWSRRPVAVVSRVFQLLSEYLLRPKQRYTSRYK